MLTGDLFVFGDVRDVLREGWRGLRGEEVDTLVLGLAGTGIAVTAGMYFTGGLAAPARVGVTVIKAARTGGHLGKPLVRLLKVETREGLLAFAGNLGKVQQRTSLRGALDGLKIAEHPKDVAKLATLAAAKGTKTRAIVKLLGRGAIFLTNSMFTLASWMFWALLNLLAFCAACKRTVERMTLRHCERRRMRQTANAGARLGSGVLGCLKVRTVILRPSVMPTFKNGDVEIAYLDEGEGDPIVLVHGFASNKEVNWVMPGWTSTLRRDGRRVIALDNRGHGQSTKLYDPAAYHTDIMAGDIAALIEHLKLPRADLMGYSLGSRICAVLAAAGPNSRAR